MMRPLRTLVCPLLWALALAIPVPAVAQPTTAPPNGSPSMLAPDSSPQSEPKTKEQLAAQQHFQRAKDLYQTGTYREAVVELEAARMLDPKAKDLVFNLGIVHEKLGKYDEAITFFRRYIEMEGVTTAERAKAESIVKRIEGAKREVPIAPAPTGTTEPAPAPAPAPPEETQRGRIDGATLGMGASAVVGLGVGTVFGILALSSQPPKNFTTGRDGTYEEFSTKTNDAHRDADRNAIISDVGFGVGIVAAAVTAYLYFGRTKEPARGTVTPSVAPVAAGGVLLLGGSFQ
jgi:hypothetical protein